MERMVLGLNASVLDHGAGVGLEPRHGASDVSIDLDDFLDGGGFQEGGGDALFDPEDDAPASSDADGGAAQLDCFKGVFDLEEATFRGEGAE